MDKKIECPMCHYRFGETDKTREQIRKEVIQELINYLKATEKEQW